MWAERGIELQTIAGMDRDRSHVDLDETQFNSVGIGPIDDDSWIGPWRWRRWDFKRRRSGNDSGTPQREGGDNSGEKQTGGGPFDERCQFNHAARPDRRTRNVGG